MSVNAASLLRRLLDRLAQPDPGVRRGAAAALAALARPLAAPALGGGAAAAGGVLLEALWLLAAALRHPLGRRVYGGEFAKMYRMHR